MKMHLRIPKESGGLNPSLESENVIELLCPESYSYDADLELVVLNTFSSLVFIPSRVEGFEMFWTSCLVLCNSVQFCRHSLVLYL